MLRSISSGGLLCVRRSSTNFMTFLLFIVMITVLFTINVHTSMAQLNHSCMPHKQYALCTYVARSIVVRFSVRVDAVRLRCRLFHIFFLENLQSFVLVLYVYYSGNSASLKTNYMTTTASGGRKEAQREKV